MGTLVSPLASGLADAPSGTVEVYQRGSTDTAYLYDEDDAPITSPTLDAYGRLVCFAQSGVDIRVRRVDGSEAAFFPVDVRDVNVEVVSPSFTGTLADGSQGLGGKTYLPTALAKLTASFGAADFLVRRTGTTNDQNLKDALASVLLANAPFYNVKDADYGAIGDGVADDSSAIQAAIDAAGAAGGGLVWFPAGQYLCNSTINLTATGVSLAGPSNRAAYLINGTASSYALVVNPAATDDCGIEIANLGILLGDANNGIRVLNAPGCKLRGIRIEQNGSTTGDPDALTVESRIFVYGLETVGDISIYEPHVSCVAGSAGTVFVGCSMYMVIVALARIGVLGCFMESTSVLEAGSGGTWFIGNHFNGSSYGITVTPTDVSVIEFANTTNGTILLQGAATYVSQISRLSRLGSTAASTSTSYTPDAATETHNLSWGSNGTVNAPTGQLSHGMDLVLWMRNTSGGNITTTLNAVFSHNITGNLATGKARCARFKYNGTVAKWQQVGDWSDYTV